MHTTAFLFSNFLFEYCGLIWIAVVQLTGVKPGIVVRSNERLDDLILGSFNWHWITPGCTCADIFGMICTETRGDSIIKTKDEGSGNDPGRFQNRGVVLAVKFPRNHLCRGRRPLFCFCRNCGRHEFGDWQNPQYHDKYQEQCHDTLKHSCFLHFIGSSLGLRLCSCRNAMLVGSRKKRYLSSTIMCITTSFRLAQDDC